MFAAVRTSLQRNTIVVCRRLASASTTIPKPPLPEMYQKYDFRKHFLSDPSTYPLIAVMATAAFFVVGMSTNALLNYKGIRINPSNKHKVIQDWGHERTTRITEVLSARPIGFHAQSLYDIRNEGLGVNHEEFLKSKEAEKGN